MSLVCLKKLFWTYLFVKRKMNNIFSYSLVYCFLFFFFTQNEGQALLLAVKESEQMKPS